MEETLIIAFSDATEAKNRLDSNKATFRDFFHYSAIVDRAAFLKMNDGKVSSIIHSGYETNEKDVYIVAMFPTELKRA